METKFQTTSFIPKASLDNVVDDRGKIQKSSSAREGTSNFLVLISFFIFVCSVVSAGIIFSLNKLALSQSKSANDSLVKSQQDIKQETIEDLKYLSNRLSIIKSLLDRHVAVSEVFNQLSKNTIRKVHFTNFSLKRKSDNTYELILSAQGIGYESIIAQDSQFSSGPSQRFFKNTSITNFVKSKGQDLTSFGINTNISVNSVLLSEILKTTNQ